MGDIEELYRAAAARGARITDCGNGHYQIHGALLVNYYPLSRNRTAYIANTKRGQHLATPRQAVALAFEAPRPVQKDLRDERSASKHYRRWCDRQWNRGVRDCHWCKLAMNRTPNDPDQMTVDHRIPLYRGGLDNPSNFVAAHARCNSNRGHDMPELHAKTRLQEHPHNETQVSDPGN